MGDCPDWKRDGVPYFPEYPYRKLIFNIISNEKKKTLHEVFPTSNLIFMPSCVFNIAHIKTDGNEAIVYVKDMKNLTTFPVAQIIV